MKRLIAIAMLFLLIGCTIDNVKPVSEMTPKEKGAWMLTMYNSQDMNYRSMAAMKDLTEDQKVMLRTKKEVLTEVYPLINVYLGYLDTGAVAPQDMEQQIIDYLDRAASMVIK